MTGTTPPWYVTAFNGSYLDRYSHRSDAAARSEIDWAFGQMVLRSGARVLDLACGAGRHSRALAARGAVVCGCDLSPELLTSARKKGVPDPDGSIAWVRCDMRSLPFAPRSFDAIGCFFTSFGYFRTDAEHRRVLDEAARILTPSGRLLLDFLNSTVVVEYLVPESREFADGQEIVTKRTIDAETKRVEKREYIRVAGESNADGSSLGEANREELQLFRTESVRLYTPDEISQLLLASGLETVATFGTLTGEPFVAADSERYISICRPRPPRHAQHAHPLI